MKNSQICLLIGHMFLIGFMITNKFSLGILGLLWFIAFLYFAINEIYEEDRIFKSRLKTLGEISSRIKK